MGLKNVITRIKALITADNKQFKKTMKDTTQTTKKAGMDFKKMGQVIAGSVAVAALIKFGKAMLNIGKSMDLMRIKAGVVFGAYRKEVEGMANDTAASMGMTKTEFINTASGIQDLLIPIGFARKEATGMTKDMMSLAGALSTWTGGTISATEVGNIFAKAMLGEREQLKTLGIALSDAEIQSELLARGQKKLTGEALAQAKAQITLDLITSKSTDAQEAFKGAGDSLVVTLAKTGSNIRGMGESLAVILNPAMGKGAKAAENLTGQLRQLLDEAAMVSSSDVLTTWEKWEYRLAGLTGGVGGMIKRMEILGMAMSTTEFDMMVDVILETGGTMEDVEKAMAQFGDLAVQHGKDYYTEAKAMREKDAAEAAAAEEERMAKQREQWAKQQEEYRKYFAGLADASSDFDESLRLISSSAEIADMKTTKLGGSVYRAGVAMDTIPASAGAAAEQMGILGTHMDDGAQSGWNVSAAFNDMNAKTMLYSSAITGLGVAFGNVMAQQEGAMKSFVTATLAGISALLNALLAQAIGGMIAGEAVKGLPGLITGAIGVGALLALWKAKVPSFATGGIVTEPTLAMVGDNPSGKEAIIPSELWGQMGSDVNVGGILHGHDMHLMNKRYGEKLTRTGRA